MSGHPSDSLSVPALCHASAEDVPATGVRVPLRAGATGGLSASAATTRVLPTGRQATRGTLVRRAICLAIVLIGLFPTSSTAAHLSATSVALIASGANPLASHSPSPSVQPLLADWLDKVLNPIVSGMRGRQRTIQVGAIMMVLALAVIWWRK